MRDALTVALWLNMVQILTSMAIIAVPVMAPAIAADLGVGTESLGTYTAIVWCGALAVLFVAGQLSARFGALRVSQMCLFMCGAGLLLAGSVSAQGSAPSLTLAVLAATGAVMGLGYGAETPTSSQLLARVSPPRHQALIFSLKQTGVQIGGMLAGVVFPAMVAWVGWRHTLLASGAVLLAATIPMELPRRRFEPDPRTYAGGPAHTFAQAFMQMLRDWRVLRLAIASAAYVSAQICLGTFLVSYLVAERGTSLAFAGSILALSQAGGLIGRVGWGAIARRMLGARAVLTLIGAAIVVCAALLGTFGTTVPVPVLALVCFVFGLTAAGWNGLHLAEVARLAPPGQVAQVIGATFILGMLGLILAPLAFGAIAAVSSYGTAYVAIGGLSVVGILVMAPVTRRWR